jgi:hypothetical protein
MMARLLAKMRPNREKMDPNHAKTDAHQKGNEGRPTTTARRNYGWPGTPERRYAGHNVNQPGRNGSQRRKDECQDRRQKKKQWKLE